MGAITRTATRDTVVDFSYPYFFTTVGFVTKKPSPVPNVMAIFWPFGKMFWFALAVSLPAFSLVLLTFSKIEKDNTYDISIGIAILNVSQMLVMQGTHLNDK